MSEVTDSKLVVRIFGVPIACSRGITDAWRQVAERAKSQLAARFGDAVSVEYHDLFSPDMDLFPEVTAKVAEGAQVPLVFLGAELLSSGGKVSIPAIARRIEALL
jgi:hypothetical protein